MRRLLAEVRGFDRPGQPLDLEIHAGDVILLRGPNGSGKTSLLRTLAGLPAPRRAQRVAVQGTDPTKAPAHRLPGLVALSPQEPRDGLVGLTVAGEFRMRRRGVPQALGGLAGREATGLSSGEARLTVLELADGEAPLLLLDEAGEGLDHGGLQRLRGLVDDHRRRGAVIAVDHQGLLVDQATRVVDLGPAAASAACHLPVAPPGPVLVRCRASRWKHLTLPALELGPGVHALAGPNGSGKSTLLRRLAGLIPDGGATVNICGVAPNPGHNVTLLPPRGSDLLGRPTVGEDLARADGRLVARLLTRDLLNRHPLTLSGGEAQRAALAKVLASPTPVVLLDEPEAHLDEPGRRVLFDLMAEATEAGVCMVIATHDRTILEAAHTVTQMGNPQRTHMPGPRQVVA